MKNIESDSGKRTTSTGSDDSRERPRIKGEIKVNMDIKEAVPAEGSSDELSNFKRDKSEIEKELAETMKKLNKLHAELLTLGNGEGSISFIMKCKSLGALECLMAKYSSGQLHEMMEDTMITPNLMDVLGVKYLKLQVTIDMEEFKLCKAELGDAKGKYRRNSTSLPCDVTFNVTGSRIPHTPLQSLHLMLPNVVQYQDSRMVHLANDIEKLSMDGATKMLLGYGDIPLLGRQRARLMKKRKHKKLNIMLLSGMSAARDSTRKSGQTQTSTSQAENDDELLQDFIHLREKVEAARKIKDALNAENFQLLEENVLEDAIDTPSILRQEIQRRDELIVNIQSKVERVQKGIVPKDTVRRLSRRGDGPGEVSNLLGLTINHNGQVVVSDYGDEDSDQPGSVKTVTADPARIISTITFMTCQYFQTNRCENV
ncbi:uncharacterized protein [Ptychodera flava]|uniref:uncharacterized protein n=1 Tax=Ptychodera flava TaxID=63121 RepID=UPI003969D5A4